MSRVVSIITLFLALNSYADEVWKEDFNSYASKTGTDGESNLGDYPDNVFKWTLDISNCDFSQSSDYFRIVSDKMRVVDSDGEARWISEEIDISGYSDVSFSIWLSGDDPQNDLTDYISVYYMVDNSDEQLLVDKPGIFNEEVVTSGVLSGNRLQIIVKVRNNTGTEQYNFDDVIVTGTPIIAPADKDSQILVSDSPVSSTLISSSVNKKEQSVEVFKFKISDSGNGDNKNTEISKIVIRNSFPNRSSEWSETIKGVLLKKSETELISPNYTVGGDQITLWFTDSPIVIDDGTTEVFTMGIWINENDITDNSTIQMHIPTIHACETTSNSSEFVDELSEKIESSVHTLDVKGTELRFIQQPSDVQFKKVMNPDVSIHYCDKNGNTDKDFTEKIFLNVNGAIPEGGIYESLPVNGIINFGGLSLKSISQNVSFTAYNSDASLAITSNMFNVVEVTDWLSIVSDPSGQVVSTIVSSLSNSQSEAVEVLRFVISDFGTNDEKPTIVNRFEIKNAYPENSADWLKSIGNVVIKSGNNIVETSSVIRSDKIEVLFNTPFKVNSNESAEVSLNLVLSNEVSDNQNLQFIIPSDNHGFISDASGSMFKTQFDKDIVSNIHSVSVVATELKFIQQPSDVTRKSEMTPSIEIVAADLSGNIDVDFSQEITLDVNNSALLNSYVKKPVNGRFLFEGLILTKANENVTITASDEKNSFEVVSTTFTVSDFTDNSTTVSPNQHFDKVIISTTSDSVEVFSFIVSDSGFDDKPTKIKALLFNKMGNDISDWSEVVKEAFIISRDNIHLSKSVDISENSLRIAFASDMLEISHNSEVLIKLFLKFNSNVIKDNEVLRLSLKPSDIDLHGGGSLIDLKSLEVTSGINTLDVIADRVIADIPSKINFREKFDIQVKATNQFGIIDTDYTGELSINSDKKLINICSDVNFEAGAYTCQNIQYEGNDVIDINITSGELISSHKEIEVQKRYSYIKKVFNDSNWSDLNNWEITEDANSKVLRHKINNETGEFSSFYKTRKIPFDNGETIWEFTISNSNWNPSSTNNFGVWLMHERGDREDEGVLLAVNYGGDSSDEIKLLEVDNGVKEIINTGIKWSNNLSVRFRVVRNSLGEWSVNFLNQVDGIYESVGNGETSSLFKENCFGVYFKASTSSRLGGVWFSDINVVAPIPYDNDCKVLLNDLTIDEISPNSEINVLSVKFEDLSATDDVGINIKSILLRNVVPESNLDWKDQVKNVVLNISTQKIEPDSLEVLSDKIKLFFNEGKIVVDSGNAKDLDFVVRFGTKLTDRSSFQCKINPWSDIEYYTHSSTIGENYDSDIVSKKIDVNIKSKSISVEYDNLLVENRPFEIIYRAVDEYGNVDVDNNNNVTFDINGEGTFSNFNSGNFKEGVLNFSNLRYSSSGDVILKVISEDLSANSEMKFYELLKTDDFTDKEIANNPQWIGDVDYFTVEDSVLQLNGKDSASNYNIFVPIEHRDSCEWSFRVKLDFNPSSLNFTKIYLLADNYIPDSVSKSYYIKLDESNSDRISFYRYQSGKDSLLFQSNTEFVKDVDTKVKIRYNKGVWRVLTDLGDNIYKSEGNRFFENKFISDGFFGINCSYKTVSRKDKFFFDDIYYGGHVNDTIRPKVEKVLVNSPNNITVCFSEPMNSIDSGINSVSSEENYTVNDTLSPIFVEYNNSSKCARLDFNENLYKGGEMNLKIANVTDNSIFLNKIIELDTVIYYSEVYPDSIFLTDTNQFVVYYNDKIYWDKNYMILNSIPVTSDFSYYNDSASLRITMSQNFINNEINRIEIPNIYNLNHIPSQIHTFSKEYRRTERNDIVFMEYMADPSPTLGLPEVEYVELKNISGYDIYMHGWEINNKEISDFLFQRDSLLIVCGDEKCVDSLKSYGNIVVAYGLTLKNSKTELKITNQHGNIIDYYIQDYSFADNQFKKNGGWSVEKIDENNLCTRQGNWKYSESFGTPGSVNSITSVNSDVENPFIESIMIKDSVSVNLQFSEPVNFDQLSNVLYYNEKSLGHPDDVISDSASLDRSVIKYFSVLKLGEVYEISVSEIQDCNSNKMIMSKSVKKFSIPEKPYSGDLIINEILFTPHSGEDKFVELYNNSNKVFTTSDILFSKYDSVNMEFIMSKPEEVRYMFPGEYYVFSNTSESVINNYSVDTPENIYKADINKVLQTKGGELILGYSISENVQFEILDKVQYSPKLHFELLDDIKGVSLERLSEDSLTDAYFRWYSASEESGFGTPTSKNSQNREFHKSSSVLSFTSLTVSPDQDGIDDYLAISYNVKKEGYMGTISIYSDSGYHLFDLIKDQLLQPSGEIIWNGLGSNGDMLNIGMYIVHFEAISDRGDKIVEDKVVVVAYK